MTRPAPFTQAGIRRMIKAAKAEGYCITGIAPDGTLVFGEVTECSPSISEVNPHSDPFLAGIEGLADAEEKRKRKRVTS
jgi:hypothetical protein